MDNADKFAAQISDALKEYAKDLNVGLDEVFKTVGKNGADLVKKNAKSANLKITGKYASGWTFQIEKSRLGSGVVIYNKNKPGLAHLLENGHAKRSGGRVEGTPHIAPAEEQLESELMNEIEKLAGGKK